MSVSGVGHMVHKRYKPDITVGALKLPESRRIADLLLRHGVQLFQALRVRDAHPANLLRQR